MRALSQNAISHVHACASPVALIDALFSGNAKQRDISLLIKEAEQNPLFNQSLWTCGDGKDSQGEKCAYKVCVDKRIFSKLCFLILSPVSNPCMFFHLHL